MAGAHAIHGNRGIAVWPNVGPMGVTIPYCYKDLWTRNRVSDAILQGWRLWAMKLGPPGPATGHRMNGFAEVKYPDGRPVYCFLPNKAWNPLIPVDSVQIMPLDGEFRGEATIGYIPPQYSGNKLRHRLSVAHNAGPLNLATRAYLVAHEMGHIFGLMHEHQRPDRDQYVHFDCTKLPNYDRVKAHIEQNPKPGVTIELLCTDSVWPQSAEYRNLGWRNAADYSTRPWWDMYHRDTNGNGDRQNHPVVVQSHGPYDYQSIMHYSSGTFMSPLPPGGVRTVSNAALVGWKQPSANPPAQVTEENAQLLTYTLNLPSDGDVAVMKHLYPWV